MCSSLQNHGVLLLVLLCAGSSCAKPWSTEVHSGQYKMQALSYALASAANMSVALPVAEIEEVETKSLDPMTAYDKLQKYSALHTNFARDTVSWFVSGLVLIVGGLVLLLYSEIKFMLWVREKDEISHLHAMGGSVSQQDEEAPSKEHRPYLTVSGVSFMFVGGICILVPFCTILRMLGLPAGLGLWSCWVVVLFGALFFGVCFSLFIVACVWSCTRPYAALALLFLSLLGDICIPTGNPLLFMMFVILGGTLFYWYFYWYPQQCADDGVQPPYWCQSIGSVQVSWDMMEWGDKLQDASKIVYGDIKHTPSKFGNFAKKMVGYNDEKDEEKGE